MRGFLPVWGFIQRHCIHSHCVPKKPILCPPVPSNESECQVNPCLVDPCQPEPAVVIVGAGIAGLSAAARLVQCGIRNITILEATERPGGRIHSCWLGDMVAEIGANFIEGGCIANPVFTLAAQEGLLQSPLDKINEKGMNLFVTSEGRAVDWSISLIAYHTFTLIKQQASALFTLAAGRSHGTLQHFITVRIQQELHKFPEEQRYEAARVMYGLSNKFRYRCGDDLSMVSADQFGSFYEIPGGKIRVPLGYIGVLAPLLRQLPDHSLRFCKPVQQIIWNPTSVTNSGAQNVSKDSQPRAIIKCCDGHSLPADYVIITMSLGVLKKQSEIIFCPPLPDKKMRAIDSIGFGHVNKIFLEFERPFWVGSEFGSIIFAWSQDELCDRSSWMKGVCLMEEMSGSCHVICLYISGPEAMAMERCSDVEVVEGCTHLLREFTGDPTLPYPKSLLRSKWSSDPYFCGSFSYMSLKSTVAHQCDLGAPLPECDETPVLLFAGEATCPGHFSTTHGARLSGIREAERIIQLTKKHMGPPRPSSQLPC